MAKPQEECAETTELGSEEHTAQKTGKNAMPGTVVSVAKDSFAYRRETACFVILEVQMPGKKTNGYRLVSAADIKWKKEWCLGENNGKGDQ